MFMIELSSADDIYHGSAEAEAIDGGGGTDVIFAGGGDDAVYLSFSGGNDMLHGEGGIDTLICNFGWAGPEGVTIDLSIVTPQAIMGRSVTITGFENITGTHVDDHLTLTAAGGIAFGLAGNDLLVGGAGEDVIEGGLGADIVQGGAGSDRLWGGGGADVMTGGSGSDFLWGDNGRDILAGLAGDDALRGGYGRDRLRGGVGSDYLNGGSGRDSFVFDDGEFGAMTIPDADRIADFLQADGDRINLKLVDANIATAGVDDAFTFIGKDAFSHAAGELRMEWVSTNTIVEGDVDGDGAADFWIRLDGLIDLTSADFAL